MPSFAWCSTFTCLWSPRYFFFFLSIANNHINIVIIIIIVIIGSNLFFAVPATPCGTCVHVCVGPRACVGPPEVGCPHTPQMQPQGRGVVGKKIACYGDEREKERERPYKLSRHHRMCTITLCCWLKSDALRSQLTIMDSNNLLHFSR